MTEQQREIRLAVLVVAGMLNRRLSVTEMERQADRLAQAAMKLREIVNGNRDNG